ncbi:spermidine resistance protein [Coemansia sp. RSA 1813]|nr:spermidine resistance protein [Coemansia sp. RSA 1646]KAJ1765931.1 spermidine resistance protein [Coemansia sp. RSA 1843]KAJ2085441.1 spermidine resistance protein [Coemansia sp. RSA 986]KAJ2210400.1 spermidine resistance protein [Coemansia sp. RSA 487]KAJ2562780.1 spermidine resistance protein [Coemansia sp. RSA 1813]
MTDLSSSGNAGGAQYAVSVTGNPIETKAEINTSCTPTCSANGTYSDGYTGAFEGPEKLLEMWFAPTAQAAAAAFNNATISQEDTNSDCYDRSSAEDDQTGLAKAGLRRVPVAVWRDMLDLVHCQILSTLSNDHVDSYLLSESSFFVYPHKLVLKTCGTTTLLYAIPRMLKIASKYLGITGAYQLFYSRKNFMFPEQQAELHRSWEKEVSYLDALFPDGSAYMIGKTNRDHWHVYLAGPYEMGQLAERTSSSSSSSPVSPGSTDVSASSSPCRDSGELIGSNVLLVGKNAAQPENEKKAVADVGAVLERMSLNAVPSANATVNNSVIGSPLMHPISRSSSRSTVQEDTASYRRSDPGALRTKADTTVEILMTGLDPERMHTMYLGGASSEEGSCGGKAVERASGIANIYPSSASDSFLFTPCGFSLNGLQGDGYYTIHVTPEPHCSYASFETNVADDDAMDLNSPDGIKNLVDKVTRVFGPRQVTVTVFKARSVPLASEGRGNTAPGGGFFASGLAKDGKEYGNANVVETAPPMFAPVSGYKTVDRVLYEFDHYWLRYAYYVSSS